MILATNGIRRQEGGSCVRVLAPFPIAYVNGLLRALWAMGVQPWVVGRASAAGNTMLWGCLFAITSMPAGSARCTAASDLV